MLGGLSPRRSLSIFAHGLRRVLRRVSKETVIQYACLSSIVVAAVLIRILPARWGFYLSEFDPYMHYEITKYVVENGFLSYFSWHTGGFASRTWYPFGRDIVSSSYPGVPFTSAFVYLTLRALGFQVTVLEVSILFPVIMAALTVVTIYFLGKEVGGMEVGLFSSLFMAVSPAYISRTSLGFYDDETIGIFAILLLFLTYLRALDLNKSTRVSLVYSVVAGLSLGYIFASWGASRYPLTLVALFTLVLLVMGRYSRRLLTSYGTLLGIGLSIAVEVPRLGLSFIRGLEPVAAGGVFLLLLFYEVSRFFKLRQTRVVFLVASIALSGVGLIVLGVLGIISLPLAKFMSVINPFTRIAMPLVESVQEHRPATWSAIYYEFGALVFLVPLGVIFAYRRLTNQSLMMILFAITSLYSAGSMIRLAIIMAPAFCIMGSLALVEVLKPFVDITRARVFTRRRMRFTPRVGRGFGVLLIVFLFLLVSYPLTRGVDSGYSPVTIASSSIPIRGNFGDWIEALSWMRYNLPDRAVVASWWDYGYWISSVGGKYSLADNGTVNGTQIARIGEMFMSNETRAIAILQGKVNGVKYNVTHVVVFTTLYPAYATSVRLGRGQPILYGDEVKWRWMARIPGLDDTKLADTSILTSLDQQLGISQDTFVSQGYRLPKGDTLLTKLIISGCASAPGFPSAQSLGVTLEHLKLVFASSNYMVFVYEVHYPPTEPL